MRRRELLEAAILSPVLPRRQRGALRTDGGWAFSLNGRDRWTLAPARGDPVVAGAEIAVELADGTRFVLAGLTGTRRIRFGGRDEPAGWAMIGSSDGLEVSARFADGTGDPDRAPTWPRIDVSVRGLAETRILEAIEFLDSGRAEVPAYGRTGVPAYRRTGVPALWLNGYQSWDGCRTIVPGDLEETGHWMLATLAARRPARASGAAPSGLGLRFGPADSGEGRFIVARAGVKARCHPGRRLVGAPFPPATASLTIVPADDPQDALARLAAGDLTRPLPPAVPAGWCSWYELYGAVTEADVIANLQVARRYFDARWFRLIQLDDGFQRSCGDWDANDKFPHGHRWLTAAIHEAGFLAGLWLAPFAVAERSGVPVARPEWLLRDERGEPLVVATREDWGGRVYALDASQRAVQDHLRDLMRHTVDEWGYDYLKLDFLHYGALGTRADRWHSGAEACRAGLRALREGAGRAYLLGCGAPLQPSAGLFDGMRIGEDVDATWEGIQAASGATLHRAPLNRRLWHNDPDAMVVREPLSLAEAQAWVSVVALGGGVALASDHLPRLTVARLDLLKRAMPVAPVAGRALDLATPEHVSAPGLYAETTRVAALPSEWRFQPGDEAAWSAPDLDEAAWEPIAAGAPWESGAGREALDGHGWYRARFRAPRRAPAGALVLDLGRIDDVDEAFVNGTRVGGTGTFPPRYRSAWQAYRRYPLPRDLVRWGRENVVAVRVYDGGGPGGWYSFRRDRPPSLVLAQVLGDRWMLAACNWDDEPRRMTVDLAANGVAGPLLVYDVWREERARDVDGRWAGTVDGRSATVVALRRRPRWPCVIGSTRHVVQGAVDLANERWDARRRVLSGRAIRLDDRPHAVTIALPAGFRARECSGDLECRLEPDQRSGVPADRRAGSGPAAVRLVIPAPEERDCAWEVSF